MAESQDTSKPTIVLAAGGTGGHLFPAYALAEELGRRGFTVDLATDMRGDRYGTGFPARAIHKLPSATFSRTSPWAALKTVWTLTRGMRAAHKLFHKIKPEVVIGFGGYPSFPPLFAATGRGIPTALHEQNAVLGRANRLLAKRVTAIATSFDRVEYLDATLEAKVRMTGNPVREIVRDAARIPYAPPKAEGPLHLLVFGGSQGARFFSESVPSALLALPDHLRSRLHVVQQCREEDAQRVTDIYERSGIRANCAPFFADLPRKIADSHLVIGRAGASTIAELTVIGRPSILVPLPHAVDNDQLQNATNLAESGGAWCIAQSDLDENRLRSELTDLFENPDRLADAADAAKRKGRPAAVEELADLVEDLRYGRRVR